MFSDLYLSFNMPVTRIGYQGKLHLQHNVARLTFEKSEVDVN